jgi:uncharacterized paraquat-inducible protein A
MFLTFIYLIACWYTSVQLVFKVNHNLPGVVTLWSLAILLDILVSLNTVTLDRGNSARTRYKILVRYIQQQSYFDIGMVVFLLCNTLETLYPLNLTLQIIVLVILVIKLNKKSKLLRSYFHLKNYVVLIDSFILLMIVSHIDVSAYFNIGSNFVLIVNVKTLAQLADECGHLKRRVVYQIYIFVILVHNHHSDCRIWRYNSSKRI